MAYILLFTGFAVVVFCSILWVGLPWFILAWLHPTTARVSAFSLSSVPAIIGSRTVYEFIQSLKDEPKREAYTAVMSSMRRLLMDIKKHREGYPAEIDDLRAFALSQLRYTIERSPASGAVETSKFRELAEQFVLSEVMQDIYLADCRASRTGRMTRKLPE